MDEFIELDTGVISSIPSDKIDTILSMITDCSHNTMSMKIILSFLSEEINNRNKLVQGDPSTSLVRNYNNFLDHTEASDLARDLIGVIIGKYNFSSPTLFSDTNYDQINNKLQKNGLYIHNEQLPLDLCDEILRECNMKQYRLADESVHQVNIFNPPEGTSWIIDQGDIIRINAVQKLVSDKFILTTVQNYLNSTPVLADSNFWVSRSGKSDITQAWHQDHDDVRFVKVFIYLSDVTEDNGPHNYVLGSLYKDKPIAHRELYLRVPENIINEYYRDSITKVLGKKGTILFENTQGYHRGCPLKSGIRYMLQFLFTVSTHALKNNKIHDIYLDHNENQVLYEAKQNYPNVYYRYRFYPVYPNLKEYVFTSGCCRLLCCFDQNIVKDKTIESIHYMNVGGRGGMNLLAHPYTPKHHLYFIKYINRQLTSFEMKNANTVLLAKSTIPIGLTVEFGRVYPTYDAEVGVANIREQIGKCKTFIYEFSSIKEHYLKGTTALHHQWLNSAYGHDLDEIVYTKEQYIEEIRELIHYLQQHYPTVKLIFMGHIRHHVVDASKPVIKEREMIHECLLEIGKLYPEIVIIDTVFLLAKEDVDDDGRHYTPSGWLKLYKEFERLICGVSLHNF